MADKWQVLGKTMADEDAATRPQSAFDTRKAVEVSALRTALAKAGAPVFAVVDGAKFDDLPNALMRERLVGRPLYSDRGGQSRDFDKTAPQMIYLDRTRDMAADPEDGPCEPRILANLFALLQDHSAAVFWFCRKGGDVLFRHLRKINRVRIQAGHLPATGVAHEQDSEDDVLLFRHADANVMAQTLPALPAPLLGRVLGPAEAIRFVPSIVWSLEDMYEFTAERPAIETSGGGMLRFDTGIMQTIESRRSIGVLRHLLLTFADHRRELGEEYKPLVVDSHRRASAYGIETLEDFELFTRTELEYGPRFEFRPGYEEAHYLLAKSSKSPTERVYYARRACLDVQEDST